MDICSSLPALLPVALQRSHWSHEDSFDGTNETYLRAFTHCNYSIGMHTHDFLEVNIVLRGTGQHYIGDSKSSLQRSCRAYPGCVFAIPAKIRHGYIDAGGLDVWHLLVHRDFIPRFAPGLSRLPGYAMLCEIEPYLRGRSGESLFLVLKGKRFEMMMNSIGHLNALGLRDDSACEVKRRCNVCNRNCTQLRFLRPFAHECHGDKTWPLVAALCGTHPGVCCPLSCARQ